MMKFLRVYRMIKAAGHSPAKAAEIIIDASRGDKHALRWIKILFSQRKKETVQDGKFWLANHNARKAFSSARLNCGT